MLLAPLAALALAGPALAAKPALKRVGTFSQPIYVTAPAGDRHRVFVVERRGVVRVLVDGKRRRRAFLDLRGRVLIKSRDLSEDERGLLSIAFAPDYAQSRRVYAFYVGRDERIHIDELRGSRRRTLLVGPMVGPIEHGGQLQFGPDGMLYASIGQSGHTDQVQDPDSLYGKLLRIDPRAGAPPPQVWAGGLRNPFRFAFDPVGGGLAIGDTGQSRRDEVDYLPRGSTSGANFGWPLFEGSLPFQGDGTRPPGYAPPVLEIRHGTGSCAVIGGYWVRDRALRKLYGRYLYGDVCTGRVRSVRLGRPRATRDAATGLKVRGGLASFGQDGRRRLYVVSIFSGRVYRIVARAR